MSFNAPSIPPFAHPISIIEEFLSGIDLDISNAVSSQRPLSQVVIPLPVAMSGSSYFEKFW
jgi:RNase H-fold protein (predicted Holliday junction resolvase)